MASVISNPERVVRGSKHKMFSCTGLNHSFFRYLPSRKRKSQERLQYCFISLWYRYIILKKNCSLPSTPTPWSFTATAKTSTYSQDLVMLLYEKVSLLWIRPSHTRPQKCVSSFLSKIFSLVRVGLFVSHIRHENRNLIFETSDPWFLLIIL